MNTLGALWSDQIITNNVWSSPESRGYPDGKVIFMVIWLVIGYWHPRPYLFIYLFAYLLIFVFQDRIFLFSLGCPGDHACLKLWDSPASAFACVTAAWLAYETFKVMAQFVPSLFWSSFFIKAYFSLLIKLCMTLLCVDSRPYRACSNVKEKICV